MTDPSDPVAERPTPPVTPTGSTEPTEPQGPVERTDPPATGARTTTKDPLRHSRTSGAWTAVVVAAVVLILLIVFIAQNTEKVHIAFLGWDGTAPLAVALLIAAAAGIVITAFVGTARIWQLRRRVRRERHA